MRPSTHGRPAPTSRVRRWQPIGRTRRLLLVVVSVTALAALASCGGDDDGESSDPTAADPTATGSASTADTSPTNTSDDVDPGDTALPNACDVIDLQEWEAITALDLAVPDQDTELLTGGGTICGVVAEGTNLPFLFTVQVAALDSPGSFANMATFLDDYVGMEEVDGIGDRALYWDQDTTYDGEAIADRPMLAFEDGAASVIIAFGADGLGRDELEQLAMAVADSI